MQRRVSSNAQTSNSIVDSESSEFDSFSSIITPNVKIGIKPLPLTSALVKSDRTLVESLNSLGYDCVLLPVTNARYKENCKAYFLEFRQRFNGSVPSSSDFTLSTISDVGKLLGSQASDSLGRSDDKIDLVMHDSEVDAPVNESAEAVNHNQNSEENEQKSELDDDDNDYDLNSLMVPHPKLNEINIITGPHIVNTIGLLSSWVELDNESRLINEFSLQVIINEVSYAQYTGISTLLIAPPKNINNLQTYADNLNTILQMYPNIELSISLPICEDTKQDPITGETMPMIDPFSTWDIWNSIRIQCNYNSKLSISLGSPKTNVPQSVVNRWLLEPVRFYLISSYRFIPNSKNYPVLNKFNQLIIWKFIQRKALSPPTLLLHGVDKENMTISSRVPDSTVTSISSSSVTSRGTSGKRNSVIVTVDGKHVSLGDLAYLEYIRYLIAVSYRNNQLLPFENFTLNSFLRLNLRPDQIYSPESLQTPLQPLSSNLDNNTYRIFEQDHAKYETYQKAITAALVDLSNTPRFHHLKGSNAHGSSALPLSTGVDSSQVTDAGSEENSRNCLLKILVVGPGRGPLIERLFSSIRLLDLNLKHIRIVGIEKNTNVMLYLKGRNKDHWNGKVQLYNCDARFWEPSSSQETGFNLIISELLGSFGCNELAPESLDYIAQFCDHQDSVFIPSEFSTFVAPVISPALYSKVIKLYDSAKFDRPFLPLWDEFDMLSSKYARVWTFRHPSRNLGGQKTYNGTRGSFENKHNRRQAHVILKCHRKGTIHGLIGYFSAVLYKDVVLSTCPTGNGPTPRNLVSWLPFYLPIEQPIHLTDEQELSIFIKRECQDGRVWYEWSMEAFMYLLLPGRTSGLRNDSNTDSEMDVDNDGSQVRVRTGVTRIHNAYGSHYSMKLC
ncbi:hypothetical protein FOA43_000290 [Brettanomyces nanus]|uniref:Protein arginine N-methyltransferase n=1 Tax=Eeniella nana TaxID=13502 RepID=A0A875RW55_EENNA|nr:uncharacterized protein FOA43_000290 [Brettanomyces nanus]QPG72986.1 hypothetical protein FOA43_000290 [Brettanomyces nanus]